MVLCMLEGNHYKLNNLFTFVIINSQIIGPTCCAAFLLLVTNVSIDKKSQIQAKKVTTVKVNKLLFCLNQDFVSTKSALEEISDLIQAMINSLSCQNESSSCHNLQISI